MQKRWISIFVFSFFLISTQAHAVRGWLGGALGPAYDTDLKTTFGFGPTAAFIFGKHFFLGGRLDFYANMNEQDDEEQEGVRVFNDQRFTMVVQTGLCNQFSKILMYGGILAGFDFGMD